MTPRIQIVGRLPVDLSRRVRAAATHQRVSLNAFLIAALSRYNALSCVVPRRPLRYTCSDTWRSGGHEDGKTRRFRRNFDAEGWPSGRWRWS